MWRSGGISRFSVKFFCLTAEKIRRGTLQSVTDFGYRNVLCLRGLRHDFFVEIVCLAVSKNFVG